MNVKDSQPTYYPVTLRKFVALSILTFGIYDAYWFYKNWTYIKRRDRSNIWPAVRTFFYPVMYFSLLADIRKHIEPGPSWAGSIALSVLLFALTMIWGLPDPFWLVSMLAFLPLVPAVNYIAAANGANAAMQANSQWKIRHWVLLAIVGPPLLFVIATTVGLLPSTQVVPGWMVWGHSKSFLERSGVLSEQEELLYFYSLDPFSFETNGNLLTDERVVAYETDESGLFYSDEARFDDIRDVRVERGDFLTPTLLTVVRYDGSTFFVALSTEGQRDTDFINRLAQLRLSKPGSRANVSSPRPAPLPGS